MRVNLTAKLSEIPLGGWTDRSNFASIKHDTLS